VSEATLLGRVPWKVVNARVRHEQRNRETYVPPISLYRWWARRPHSLIGALLDAACESQGSPVISDPFSGGGTVAMEAARRGLAVYAQDLHPWAVRGLASALEDVDAEVLEAAADALLSTLAESCAHLYTSSCPQHGGTCELSHVFWVRRKLCPTCDAVNYLYPYSLLTLASRGKDEENGFFGCSTCGAMTRHQARGTHNRTCGDCGGALSAPDVSLLGDRVAHCVSPSCDTQFEVFDGTTPEWMCVLVQRVCSTPSGVASHFDKPTPGEERGSVPCVVPSSLLEAVPPGRETGLLLRAGFSRWADVYPPRQLRTLVACADAIDSLDTSEAIRTRLRLALCGAAEMAGYLSRWDRYYPKAFEAMANHRFPALGFACETNLLATRGRGTLRRRLAHSVAAARWSTDNIPRSGSIRTAGSVDRRRPVGRGALLVCGSSERQLASDRSVDLVLTDPPYFDDVQYAELASLLLAWARAVGLSPDSVSVDLAAEAVANSSRGAGVPEYKLLLMGIFREAVRTLKPRGRLVLTYHNTDIRAWWALASALHEAGLSVRAVAVAEAENGTDHAKRGSNAFTSDLVIECRRTTKRAVPVSVIKSAETPEAHELLAAGRTIAKGGGLDLPSFVEQYRSERGEVATIRIRVPEPEKQ
jgi:putative DNA methylase